MLVALLACQVLAKPVDLSGDERLKPKVSFVALNESLERITSRLGKTTGVPLEVSPGIRDRKATLVFRQRAGVEAMRALSNALFLEWQPESGGYRLRMPERTKNLEAAQQRFEEDWTRKTIATRLGRLAKYGDRMRQDITATYLASRSALENAKTGRGGSLTAEDRVRLVQEVEDLEDPLFVGIASVLSRGNAAAALAAGEEIVLSTESKNVASRLPLHWASPLFANGERRATLASFVAIRYRPDDGYLEARTATAYEKISHLSSWSHLLRLSGLEAPPPGPLEREMEAWAKESDLNLLGKGIDPEQASLPESEYLAKAATLAEHLRYLSEAADVPVVADGFRLPVSRANAFEGKTIREYLDALRRESEAYGVLEDLGPIHTEDGWLIARHQLYWRLMPAEVPERLLAPMETRLAEGKDLRIEDYAWFATQLTDPQIRALETLSRERPRRLYRFSIQPFIQGIGILRLWAGLTDAQRQAARSEAGLSFTRLNERQWAEHKGLIRHAILNGTASVETMPLLWEESVDPRDSGIRLFEVPNRENIGNMDSLVLTPSDLTGLSGPKATQVQIELTLGQGAKSVFGFFPEKGRKR